MPYTVNVREHTVVQAQSIAATGDKASWAPGKFPHIVRAAMMVIKVAGAAVGQIKGDKRPTAGSDTSRGDGDVFTLNIPNPAAQGKVLFKENLNVRIDPGQEVVVEVITAVAAMTSNDFLLFLEMVPEVSADLTGLLIST